MQTVIQPDYTLGWVSDQRATPRTAVTLPVLIVLGGKRYTAELRNISSTGAMIATAAPLFPRSRVEFQCGTICSRGIVHWQRRRDFGIKFRTPICVRQLSEQTVRSAAMASRLARPAQSIVPLDLGQ